MTEKILICENDHSHSKIIANSLINEGYFVKTVRTGKEAIENLSSDYGIIIVNLLVLIKCKIYLKIVFFTIIIVLIYF